MKARIVLLMLALGLVVAPAACNEKKKKKKKSSQPTPTPQPRTDNNNNANNNNNNVNRNNTGGFSQNALNCQGGDYEYTLDPQSSLMAIKSTSGTQQYSLQLKSGGVVNRILAPNSQAYDVFLNGQQTGYITINPDTTKSHYVFNVEFPYADGGQSKPIRFARLDCTP